jgi:hypothetical protein
MRRYLTTNVEFLALMLHEKAHPTPAYANEMPALADEGDAAVVVDLTTPAGQYETASYVETLELAKGA